MEGKKYAWRCVAVCTVASVWLVGCANNEFSAPISRVDDNHNNFNSKARIQMVQPHTATTVMSRDRDQMNVPHTEKMTYKRSYKMIPRGSYSGTTYQVKHGDTLFYIAWITGNDYRDLANRNNIPEPYDLNVNQILKTDMEAPTSSVNTQLTESSMDHNQNNGYSKSVSKQSISKILPSLNGQMLSSSSTVATTIVPVAVPNTVITGWHWPTNGKIINDFSRAEGSNKGVDISGSKGQPILATASGRVVYAGNALRGYGNLIIIKHNDDYLSAYAHNDTMLVFEQQEVRAGQKIATMGSTGTNSTKLHFEIRYKGKSVNPLNYLPS